MSQEYCWECEDSYARDELFDIPVFNKGYTIRWCLNCAMKQLAWTDYRLVPKPKKYKKFRIQSVEDWSREGDILMQELRLCHDNHYSPKLKDNDERWNKIHIICTEIMNEEEEVE